MKKQQLEPEVEQQTSSKLGKEYVKAVYCHPAYLNYMQSTSFEMPGWLAEAQDGTKIAGEIWRTSTMQIQPLWQKAKKN